MTQDLNPVDLENELAKRIGPDLPYGLTSDVGAALQLADVLESKGFTFSLQDLCPKSLDDSLWKATFSRNGLDYVVENRQPALAICVAAMVALQTNPDV